jgi:hypothetical protein
LVAAAVANAAGTLTLYNSIIAYAGSSSNAWGSITDGGFNISSDGSANFNSGSSFNLTDPRLKALDDYGGPTPTMALDSDSPAIDFGASAGAPLNQRGLIRPSGPGVDMVFELQSTSPQILKLVLSEKMGALVSSDGTECVLILQDTSNLPFGRTRTNRPILKRNRSPSPDRQQEFNGRIFQAQNSLIHFGLRLKMCRSEARPNTVLD